MNEFWHRFLGMTAAIAADWTVWASAAAGTAAKPLALAMLCFAATCGLTAIISPRCFAALARQGGRWIDISRIVELLDTRYDVDGIVLRRPRLFGAVVGIAAAYLALLLYWF